MLHSRPSSSAMRRQEPHPVRATAANLLKLLDIGILVAVRTFLLGRSFRLVITLVVTGVVISVVVARIPVTVVIPAIVIAVQVSTVAVTIAVADVAIPIAVATRNDQDGDANDAGVLVGHG